MDGNYTTPDYFSHINSHGTRIDNLENYGRLYRWNAAFNALPPGWRLPTQNDWDNLARSVGGTKAINGNDIVYNGVGAKLKSRTGWDRYFVRNEWLDRVEEVKHKEPLEVQGNGKYYHGGGNDVNATVTDTFA